jgi:hypothetical protein
MMAFAAIRFRKTTRRAERVLAGMVILLMVALPLGLLMTG